MDHEHETVLVAVATVDEVERRVGRRDDRFFAQQDARERAGQLAPLISGNNAVVLVTRQHFGQVALINPEDVAHRPAPLSCVRSGYSVKPIKGAHVHL